MFEIIALYVAVAVLEGTARSVSAGVSRLLDKLVARVIEHVGVGAVEEVRRSGGDLRATSLLAARIEHAAVRNQALTAELRKLIAEIDRAGGRRAIRQVFGPVHIEAPHSIATRPGDVHVRTILRNTWNTKHVPSNLIALSGIVLFFDGVMVAQLTNGKAAMTLMLVAGISLGAIGALWNRFRAP